MISNEIKYSICEVCEAEFPLTRADRRTCTNTCAKKRLRSLPEWKERNANSGHASTDFCPICEFSAPNYRQLAKHMKSAHNRLIREQDIVAQEKRLQDKLREIESAEEELFAQSKKTQSIGNLAYHSSSR